MAQRFRHGQQLPAQVRSELQVREQDDGIANVGQARCVVNDAGGGKLENVCTAGYQRDLPGGLHAAYENLGSGG